MANLKDKLFMGNVYHNVNADVIYRKASLKGLFTHWSRGSAQYIEYVGRTAMNLCKCRKGKPEELVKVSACLVGHVYDKFKPDNSGNFPELDMAIDIVNAMSKHLRGGNVFLGTWD